MKLLCASEAPEDYTEIQILRLHLLENPIQQVWSGTLGSAFLITMRFWCCWSPRHTWETLSSSWWGRVWGVLSESSWDTHPTTIREVLAISVSYVGVPFKVSLEKCLANLKRSFKPTSPPKYYTWICAKKMLHQFSLSVMSDSLSPHEPQHTRPPCPSPTPRVYSNSCPLSQWWHPAISSSVVPFSSHLQSFPASGYFQMNQFFTSGGQSIGVSASTSVLPMNIQDWFPLGWTA